MTFNDFIGATNGIVLGWLIVQSVRKQLAKRRAAKLEVKEPIEIACRHRTITWIADEQLDEDDNPRGYTISLWFNHLQSSNVELLLHGTRKLFVDDELIWCKTCGHLPKACNHFDGEEQSDISL